MTGGAFKADWISHFLLNQFLLTVEGCSEDMEVGKHRYLTFTAISK